MRIRTEFQRETTCIRHVWIEMSDGCRLAARVWLPVDAERDPVPAILEYIPYRKNDWTAVRDSVRQPYVAGYGYAAVRVDLRGSGDSEGILEDQYLELEQSDALEILRWIAAQPWCTGKVGMIGWSWGGFNSLQVAALRPPELGAIIVVDASDDNYDDNEHYWGGAVLAQYMLPWAAHMLAFNARPPDPRVVGDRWREIWLDRLDRTPPFVEQWIAHQRRDEYWKHGSVDEDYDAIQCPVYLVGGWADAFPTPMLRLAERLIAPRRCLIGPWSHAYPDDGVPGPAIGFLRESLRWWDQWLKGIDTGIMDEPMCRFWMQDSVEPRTFYAERPGRWVTERAWPSSNVTTAAYHLHDGSLTQRPGAEGRLQIRGAQVAGMECGDWCAWGKPADLPPDQRREDGMWLTFTSEPLQAPLEILGAPLLRARVASDQPQALIAARLCDVAPDGRSTLVSSGVLNLTHRTGHDAPTALEPGEPYAIELRMKATAYHLPAGHRLRFAISPTFWPLAWPSPRPVTLTIHTGGDTRVEIPNRAGAADDAEPPAFAEPEGAAPMPVQRSRGGAAGRLVQHDLATGCSTLTVDVNHYFGATRLVNEGVEFGATMIDRYSIVEDQPLSAFITCEREVTIEHDGGWSVRVRTNSTMSADHEAFYVTNAVEAYDAGVRMFTRSRSVRVPRDNC
jgi:putative CocE/NonD family hydrolase